MKEEGSRTEMEFLKILSDSLFVHYFENPDCLSTFTAFSIHNFQNLVVENSGA